jgi:Na+/melibiose symporter-like transporter
MQFIFVLGYIILTSAAIYMLSYVAGLNEGQQSIFYVANTLLCLVSLPIATGFANKFDKKLCVYVFLAASAVALVIFFFVGVNGFMSALVFAFCLSFATTVFYGILYSLIYDCCQVHELATGKQSEGSMLALSRFAQTLASALGGLALGLLLTAIGYDPANVTEATTNGILLITTLVPAGMTLLSLVVLLKYKITPARFQEVLDALKNRHEGKEVDLNEFKDLI